MIIQTSETEAIDTNIEYWETIMREISLSHTCENCKWSEERCTNKIVVESTHYIVDGFFAPPKDFGCNQWKKR